MTRAGLFWRMVGRSLSLGANLGLLTGGAVSLLVFAWWAGLWPVGVGLAGGFVLGLALGLLNGLALGALTCRFFFPLADADRRRYRRIMGVTSVLVSLGGTWGAYQVCHPLDKPATSFAEFVVIFAAPFVGFVAWWASGHLADWYGDQQQPERIAEDRDAPP